MKFPGEVVVKGEARVLIDKGRYVRYSYVDADSGKKKGKYALILRNEKGEKVEMFVVRMKTGKSLIVKEEKLKGAKKILTKEKKIISF